MKFAALALAACIIVAVSGLPAQAFPGGATEPKAGSAIPPPKTNEPISGKVVQTMDSGGYTYVQLDNNGKKTWVAAPKMKVKTGEQIAFMPGNIMYDFKSDTLKKTFDTIVFSPGPVVLPGTKADKKAAGKSGGEKVAIEKVDKAKGATAQTVGDCYKDSAKLDTKTVSVHGKAVKVSKGIMGKNWVHIQDGTGDPKEGTHNLVVTTLDEPAVGDVVTATGTLAKDKDFGYGYKYEVIVEDAKVTK